MSGVQPPTSQTRYRIYSQLSQVNTVMSSPTHALQSATLPATNATLCSSTRGAYAGTVHPVLWPATPPRCTPGPNSTASWHSSIAGTSSLCYTGEVCNTSYLLVLSLGYRIFKIGGGGGALLSNCIPKVSKSKLNTSAVVQAEGVRLLGLEPSISQPEFVPSSYHILGPLLAT